MATPYERGTRETLQRFGRVVKGKWNNMRGGKKGGGTTTGGGGGGTSNREFDAWINPSSPENFDFLMEQHAKKTGQPYVPYNHGGVTTAAAGAKEQMKEAAVSQSTSTATNVGKKAGKGGKVRTNWVEDAANPIRDALGGLREGGLPGLFGGTEKAAFSRAATLGIMALPAGFGALNAFHSLQDKNYGAAAGWVAGSAAGVYGMRKLALSDATTNFLKGMTKKVR